MLLIRLFSTPDCFTACDLLVTIVSHHVNGLLYYNDTEGDSSDKRDWLKNNLLLLYSTKSHYNCRTRLSLLIVIGFLSAKMDFNLSRPATEVGV